MELPEFKYHPDPVGTGVVEQSENECVCCGRVRGFVYTGPVFAEEELVDSICPWCIANGIAHEKYAAEFNNREGIGDYGTWVEVAPEVKSEVAYRTPGFRGWQQERWWTHCGDAAIFLGAAGKSEIEQYGKQLEKVLMEEAGLNEEQWVVYFSALSKSGSPTAYVFKCSKCAQLGGYSDCD